MSSKSVVTLTTGVSGSGKTYYRCAVFLVDEWLPHHSGKLICNYPIKMEALVEDFGEWVRDRIEIIPQDVLEQWRNGNSGPWDYFYKRDISGCHVAIDEIHNYCPKTADTKIRKKWMQFVGELRHMGATIEFLTQNEAKCAKELVAEAEIRYEVINGENLKMPILRYRMGDLYEFRAKLLGKYLCPSYCIEYTQARGDWVKIDEHAFFRMPKYFKYYDSFSAPEHGLALGHEPEKRPWEKYSWPGLFLWFYSVYPVRLSFHVGCLIFFVWFFFCGGLVGCVDTYLGAIGAIDKVGKSEKIEEVSEVSGGSPVSVSKGSSGVTSGGSFRVVTRRSVTVCTTTYCRLSNGRVLVAGDPFYGSEIEGFIPREELCALADGFVFPLSWLLDDGF